MGNLHEHSHLPGRAYAMSRRTFVALLGGMAAVNPVRTGAQYAPETGAFSGAEGAAILPTPVEFPTGFFWGAATAGHQVEGNSHNDWSEWERSEARLADLRATGQIEKYGLSNFISGRACDHYARFAQDFRLAKQLGHNATRFSIEWSRIEPRRGEFDQAEIAHYVDVGRCVRELGIEPFVTLWHWPVPLWLRDMGGWHNSETPHLFARYCEVVVKALGPLVRFWLTLNEPEVYAANSYAAGIWPPQKTNPVVYFMVLRNLIAGHCRAYELIKRANADYQVGIAKANILFEALRGNFVNMVIKRCLDWWWNEYFLDKIRDRQDFIGLNFYMQRLVNYGLVEDPTAKLSDVGWELWPEAIGQVLCDLKKYGKPIYITENGVADARDEVRSWFICETLCSIVNAVRKGVDVRGYLHWSLMDNFEWDKGFWPRFGLIEIDYETLRRKPRPSALLYSDICMANGISKSILEKHGNLPGLAQCGFARNDEARNGKD
jgi:beta-glucosidase